MNPIFKYLKDMFASERILGDDTKLIGMAKADALLQELVNQNRVPGLAITVLKEGKTIFQKGYGYQDLEAKKPVHPKKTIFRIASISKPIAATALAIMVEEGIIDLDNSFYSYVPYYPKKKWSFTIRQLAGHTAGIRAYKGKEFGLNKPYGIKDSLAIFQADDLLFEPGKGYLYNSFDWVLISLAMQEASGIPFEDYVQEKVLNPLGMQSTYTPENPSLSPGNESVNYISNTADIATFYSKNGLGFRHAMKVNNFYKLAGGGYLSTSHDIANFGQAHLEEKLVLPEMRAQFLTAQEVNEKSTYYGLGWQVSEDAKGRKFYGHVGCSVGAYSNLFVYPEEQMVFSILINCTDSKTQDVLDGVIDLFFTENALA